MAGAALFLVGGLIFVVSSGSNDDGSVSEQIPLPVQQVPIEQRDPAVGTSIPNDNSTVSEPTVPKLSELIRSIVYIQAECDRETWSGSGTIVLDGTYVLTNHHVAPGSECDYLICFTESWDREPICEAFGEPVVEDVANDLAVLRLVDEYGRVFDSGREPIAISNATVGISEQINLVGYPGVGGETITSVSGVVSGITNISAGFGEIRGEFLKTDARSGPGVSGGAAFNSVGQYIGTPTGGSVDAKSVTSLGLVRPARFAQILLTEVGQR